MSAEPIEPDASEGVPDEHTPEPVEGLTEEQQSFAEQALANLLTGPFDKVSITMPAALKQRIAARAVDMNFSAYVTEVLEQEERRRSLIDFLDYMDELHGPPSEDEIAKADRRWEEMWEKYESSEASS
ncbi:MAG TPA: hypothetical protein VGP37_07580 [Candidatus Nanopelagicales bacterium]|nr:hypothetical protein [Candidatus Nanopelagicales bacterium]